MARCVVTLEGSQASKHTAELYAVSSSTTPERISKPAKPHGRPACSHACWPLVWRALGFREGLPRGAQAAVCCLQGRAGDRGHDDFGDVAGRGRGAAAQEVVAELRGAGSDDVEWDEPLGEAFAYCRLARLGLAELGADCLKALEHSDLTVRRAWDCGRRGGEVALGREMRAAFDTYSRSLAVRTALALWWRTHRKDLAAARR